MRGIIQNFINVPGTTDATDARLLLLLLWLPSVSFFLNAGGCQLDPPIYLPVNIPAYLGLWWGGESEKNSCYENTTS